MDELPNSSTRRPLRPAVFLDRDGTLIEDRGWLADPAEVRFFPETFDALAALQKHFRLFIVTNQSGVAEGRLGMDAVHGVNQHIAAVLQEEGIRVTQTYVCPHGRQDHCRCRKPKSYFLQQAAADYGIDLRRSYSVGDHPCDAELAARAGGKGLYLLTGHGRKHHRELAPGATVLDHIGSAADWILADR